MKTLPFPIRMLLVVITVVAGIILAPALAVAFSKLTADTPQWTTFNSSVGEFSVLMPGTPTDKAIEQATDDSSTSTYHQMTLAEPVTGESFVITYYELTAAQFQAYGSSEVMLTEIKAAMSATHEIQSSAPVMLEDNIGEKLLMITTDASVKTQVVTYVVGLRVYALSFSMVTDRFSQSDADKFTDSFALLQS